MAEIQAPSLQDEAQTLLVSRCEGVYLTPEGREMVLRALDEARKGAQLWQTRAESLEAKLSDAIEHAKRAKTKLGELRELLADVDSPAAPQEAASPPPPSAEPAGDFRNVTYPEWEAQLCTCGHPRSRHAEGATFCAVTDVHAGGMKHICFCQKFMLAKDTAAEVVGQSETGIVDPKWGRVESAWHIFIFNGISVAVCGEAIDAPAVYSQPIDPEMVCIDCLESGHPKALEYKASLTPAAEKKKRNVPETCVIAGCEKKGAARNQWCCTEHAAKLPLPERQAALAAWKAGKDKFTAVEAARG